MARKSRKNIMPQSAAPEIRISEEVNLLRTAAYARLSSENSGHETEDTLNTQILQIHSYIKEHPGLTLTDTYVDNGFTGTNFDRPEFERMMQDVRTGKISVQEKEGDNTMFLSYCARKNAYDGSNEADSSSGLYHVRRRKDGKRNAEQRWSGFHPFYQGEGKFDCISDSGNRRTAAALI